MMYDIEHYTSFNEHCEKDKNNFPITETYLPKTLKYCIEHNIEVLPHNECHEEDIYIPCYLFMIRYGYFVSIKNEKAD